MGGGGAHLSVPLAQPRAPCDRLYLLVVVSLGKEGRDAEAYAWVRRCARAATRRRTAAMRDGKRAEANERTHRSRAHLVLLRPRTERLNECARVGIEVRVRKQRFAAAGAGATLLQSRLRVGAARRGTERCGGGEHRSFSERSPPPACAAAGLGRCPVARRERRAPPAHRCQGAARRPWRAHQPRWRRTCAKSQLRLRGAHRAGAKGGLLARL